MKQFVFNFHSATQLCYDLFVPQYESAPVVKSSWKKKSFVLNVVVAVYEFGDGILWIVDQKKIEFCCVCVSVSVVVQTRQLK
jgi:ABC-type thiamine transport system ATPase subunit